MTNIYDVDANTFVEENCNSAQEFLDAITAQAARNNRFERWAFRGQRNASWKLVPSAHRPNAMKEFGALSSDPKELVDVEKKILEELSKSLRVSGREVSNSKLRDSGDKQGIEWSRAWSLPSGYWPTIEVIPLMALAQHYSLPTSLLDWSLSPATAAYFAASGAARARAVSVSSDEDRLAVWAVDAKSVATSFTVEVPPVSNFHVDFVFPSHSGNPNQEAQRGCFSIIQEEDSGRLKTYRSQPSFDELVIEQLRHAYGVIGGILACPAFCKFTLPVSEASHLMRALATIGVRGSSLFPGVWGNAVDAKDSFLMRRAGVSRRLHLGRS